MTDLANAEVDNGETPALSARKKNAAVRHTSAYMDVGAEEVIQPRGGVPGMTVFQYFDVWDLFGTGLRSRPIVPAVPTVPIASVPASTFVTGSYRCSDGDLAYKLYTPAGFLKKRLPLLVLLHGCGQSPEDFARGTGMNRLADEFGFLVLYPQQSISDNLGRCWNWHRVGDQRRGRGEPAVLASLTREILAKHRGNEARVYIGGLSAGGTAAAIAATAYPELFVALGVHSGLDHCNVASLFEALSVMRNGANEASKTAKGTPPPTIVFHGGRDRTVHPSNATSFLRRLRRSSDEALRDDVLDGRSDGGRDYTRTRYRRSAGGVQLEDWVVHESGHAWSGGDPAGSLTDPAGPDASREMVRFFLARRRKSVGRAVPVASADTTS